MISRKLLEPLLENLRTVVSVASSRPGSSDHWREICEYVYKRTVQRIDELYARIDELEKQVEGLENLRGHE